MAIRTPTRNLTGLCALAALLLAGCANMGGGSGENVTVSAPNKFTHTNFLTNYSKMVKAPGSDGALCWRDDKINLQSFKKVMITRIVVTLKDDQAQGIDPTNMKALTDYFYKALVTALKPQFEIVDKPGPGVIVIRIALTDLVPTSVGRSLTGTLIPYGFIAEASSGVAAGDPAGSTPYLGQTGMEIQFLDGASRTAIGECVDTQIGRKYAADVEAGASGATTTWINGYMNSFQAWTYAQNAFDKWSMEIANRLAVLRGVAPTAK